MNGQLTRRASYAELSLYVPDRQPAPVDLSDNTNRWGVPPAVTRVLSTADVDALTRYPEVYAATLKEALAEYVGVEPSQVVTGCGSDDVLDSAIRAVAEPGARLAIPDPSFAMIPKFARMNGLDPVLVPLGADCDVDVDAMLGSDPRVAYLCAPNNPTGTMVDADRIARLAARLDGTLIVDEAYAEFGGGTVVDLVSATPNMLVVRTMSKAFGLAGLRVGYAIGAPELVTEVEKSRGPYKVSSLAAAAAVAALRDGMDWVREHVALAIANRVRFADALRALGFAPLPSQANFVLVPVTNAGAIAAAMRQHGVAVRPFEGLRPVTDSLRITTGSAIRVSIGPWEMLRQALDALEWAVAACA